MSRFFSYFTRKKHLHAAPEPSINRRNMKSAVVLTLGFCAFVLLVLFVQKDMTFRQVSTESEQFNEYLSEQFKKEVCCDLITFHYSISDPEHYDIENVPTGFGTYSTEGISHSSAQIENALSALSSFTYDSLSVKDRVTYDILSFSLKNQQRLNSYPQFFEPLSSNGGLHSELPILLAEYSLTTVEDVENYLNLLSAYDEYLSELLAFEQFKSEKGTLMSEENLHSVISQCKAFVDAGEDNILITSFEHRMDEIEGLSEFQRDSYIEANEIIVTEQILPAYKELVKGLSDLPANPYAQGLCHYPGGTEYYEALVESKTGSSRTIDELMQMTELARYEDLTVISDLLKEGVSANNTVSSTFTTPDEMLTDLQQKITDAFLPLEDFCPDMEYEVNEVDASLSSSLAPAFYLTCPIDNQNEQVIYINPAFEYDTQNLYTTLAHEAFPGHLYQTCFAHACKLPEIRYLLSFKGYSEGWATYVEMLSYSYIISDSKSASLAQHNNAATLSLYATADFGIHYSGWSVDDLSEFLATYGIRSEDVANEIYQAILSNPANYLSYYIGYLEFLQLKEKAISTYGDDFDIKQFHNAVLSIGPAPFSVLNKYFDTYYSSSN